VDAIAELKRGRDSYAKSSWKEAFESLYTADRAAPLGAEDLELLARSAYMLGRDDDYVSGLERAHQAHLEAGGVAPAARCAFGSATTCSSEASVRERADGSRAGTACSKALRRTASSAATY
jgi:hypothetical protein